MQALKARFNGNSGEVVKYARAYGILATMAEFDVKDYVAMLTFLKDMAPGEEFQATKVEANVYSGPDAFDKFCEAMLRKYSRMEVALKTKDARIAELEKQLDYYKSNKRQQTRPIVEGLLNYCEEK